MISQYLERLFTWESLENTARGVEFELKNRLTDARFEGITAARIDGESVAISKVSLELPDGRHLPAAEITPDDPLVFDLGETTQVVLDRERLRLGTHELEIGMEIEGFGAVSFDVTDEVTEADLLDVDPADYTVAELRDLVDAIAEPVELERLLERERDGKDRKTAKEAIERRLEDAKPLEQEPVVGNGRDGRDRSAVLGGSLAGLVSNVLETPKQVTVYTAARTCGSGSAAEVARLTLLTEATVEQTLEDLVMDGVVERADGGYRAKPPLAVLRSRSTALFDMLRSTTGN